MRSRPWYCWASVNVGLVIGSVTPRPAPKPWANAVFPAPRSPASSTRSPGSARAASAAARSRVSSTEMCGRRARWPGRSRRGVGSAASTPPRLPLRPRAVEARWPAPRRAPRGRGRRRRRRRRRPPRRRRTRRRRPGCGPGTPPGPARRGPPCATRWQADLVEVARWWRRGRSSCWPNPAMPAPVPAELPVRSRPVPRCGRCPRPARRRRRVRPPRSPPRAPPPRDRRPAAGGHQPAGRRSTGIASSGTVLHADTVAPVPAPTSPTSTAPAVAATQAA